MFISISNILSIFLIFSFFSDIGFAKNKCETSLSAAGQHSSKNIEDNEDPFLFLEDVDSERSLAWVESQNEATRERFFKDPLFAEIKSEIAPLFYPEKKLRLPDGYKGFYYELEKNKKNERGVYRRTAVGNLEDIKEEDARWEVIFDLDQISKRENKNWIYKGFITEYQNKKRAFLLLSDGGKDAVVYREFDLTTKDFVKDGFQIPEGRSSVTWLDEDTILVADISPKTPERKSYPNQIRKMKRGQKIEDAEIIFESLDAMGVSAGVYTNEDSKEKHVLIRVGTDFYNRNYVHYDIETSKTAPIKIPSDFSIKKIMGGRLWLSNQKAFQNEGKKIKAGSLFSVSLRGLLESQKMMDLNIVFSPAKKEAVQDAIIEDDVVFVNLLNNVKGEILRLKPTSAGWEKTVLQIDPNQSLAMWQSADRKEVFIETESSIHPPSYYKLDLKDPESKLKFIRVGRKKFESGHLVSEMFEATSRDGTQIPYTVVRPKNLAFDGKSPTILYGYGGFRVNSLPHYSGITGKAWLARGGVYVIANIRGGGELGEQWHDSATKKNKQKSYDDFIAVAEDLAARKITSARHLGIWGGSNGGLLVGAVMVQRPELCQGVVCDVPLLDMMRFHKLLVGSSWIGEYGNPDVPEMQETILKYSPYQNVQPWKQYPRALFVTSTKDDRVHPGHARKMTAKLQQFGTPVYLYENKNGGHASSSTPSEAIDMYSLRFTYLWRILR